MVPGQAACAVTYSKNENFHGEGGTRAPGIAAVEDCQLLCSGYGGGSEKSECYGIDFDRRRRQCYLFTKREYQLSTTKGIDHYNKFSDCRVPLASGLDILHYEREIAKFYSCGPQQRP